MVTLALTLVVPFQAPPAAISSTVVFVCEHGAATSLIATAHFNKLAVERGLAVRAGCRGVDPQDALSVSAVADLKADGIAIPEGHPTAIGAADVAAASHIFASGCTLPAGATQSGTARSWDDGSGVRTDAERDRSARQASARRVAVTPNRRSARWGWQMLREANGR